MMAAALDLQLRQRAGREEFTEATSSSESFSRRRASARCRASSAFASSMFSAAMAISVRMATLFARDFDHPFAYGQKKVLALLCGR